MVREFATALTFGAVLAGAAAGQSVTASATILERVEADAIEVDIRSHAGRLSVAQPVTQSERGARLLRSTFVSDGSVGDDAATVPVRVHSEGALRLERRALPMGIGSGTRMEAGEALLIDVTDNVTITRVIASNS